MDRPLDGVAVVVDEDDHGGEALPGEGAQFLDGHLGRAVADQQQTAPGGVGELGAEQCGQRVADRAPQRLGDELRPAGQAFGAHAEERGALLRHHGGLRARPGGQGLPQVRLGQRSRRVGRRPGHRGGRGAR